MDSGSRRDLSFERAPLSPQVRRAPALPTGPSWGPSPSRGPGGRGGGLWAPRPGTADRTQGTRNLAGDNKNWSAECDRHRVTDSLEPSEILLLTPFYGGN